MSYFQEARCAELSTIDYLETQINASWTAVSTIKSFTNAYKTALPVVCIRLLDTGSERREIGGTTLLNDYTIAIDLFCKSDGQRIDLAAFILDKLKDPWTYSDYSQTSGAPETLTKVANGKLHVRRFIENNKIDFGEEGVDKYDLFRHILMIQVRKV